MRKALQRIFFLLYLFTLPPMAACYLSQWISPVSFWPLAFFGLLFPVLIIIQIAFLLIFLINRSKAIVLPVILIVLGWNSIIHTFQVSLADRRISRENDQITVMTYNVRLFDIAHYWSGHQDNSEGVFSYISDLKPDVLCFQEFAWQEPGKFSIEFIKGKMAFLPHTLIEPNFTSPNRKHGLAIFSRYPIVQSGIQHFEDTKNMMLFADILVGKDTLRILNNHLESIHFDRDEFQWIDSTSNETIIPRDKLTEIGNRMKRAYIKRAAQADLVRKSIDSSPYPVVVCGDFNDTPISYAVNKIGSGLTDSFRSGGRWLGITFPNIMAPLRIDYILHSKEMVSSGYRIGRVDFSDHRPVSCLITPGSADSSRR